MRDAAKQISKPGAFVWLRNNSHCHAPARKLRGVGRKRTEKKKQKKKQSFCQRKIAAQFIAKVHYSANVARLSPDQRRGGNEGLAGWGVVWFRCRCFASSSQLFVFRHLFNYKVRKMLAYFSADTDEAQVMQASWDARTQPPPPRKMSVHSPTAR